MYAVAAIGLIIIVLSLMMIASPAAWSHGILRFSEKPYFHIAEIALRILLGIVLLYFAPATKYPLVFTLLGGGLVIVGLFLIAIGPKRHIAFAERSAGFTHIFRPAGFAGVLFGALMIYAAIV